MDCRGRQPRGRAFDGKCDMRRSLPEDARRRSTTVCALDGNGRVRSWTPSRVAKLAAAAVAAAAVLATACARQWPAEPPDAHQWQLTTGPLNLEPQREAGRVITAFAYARQRPRPPSCDGLGVDDCTAYTATYGRQLPARLSVTCWDERADGEGGIDITFTPSRPVLDHPEWHPQAWGGWKLDFDGDSGAKDVVVGARDDGTLALVDGFVAFLPGERLVGLALDFFREAAGTEDAQLQVTALFPESDGSAPLTWLFDIGAESKAAERLRHVVENCGRIW